MSDSAYSFADAARLAELFTLMVEHIGQALPGKQAMIAILDRDEARASLLFNGNPDDLRELAAIIETAGQRQHVTVNGEFSATDKAN